MIPNVICHSPFKTSIVESIRPLRQSSQQSSQKIMNFELGVPFYIYFNSTSSQDIHKQQHNAKRGMEFFSTLNSFFHNNLKIVLVGIEKSLFLYIISLISPVRILRQLSLCWLLDSRSGSSSSLI